MEDDRSVKQTETEKYPNRWKKGQSGNPNGRPRKPEVEELRMALEEAQAKRNKSFLQHFIERAYESDNVAIALARKLIPDKVASEQEINVNSYETAWLGLIIKSAYIDDDGKIKSIPPQRSKIEANNPPPINEGQNAEGNEVGK